MIYADYKCKKCDHIFEGGKNNILDDFPKLPCPECNSENTYRVFNFAGYEVCVGKVGNAKSGYANHCVYHPTFTGKSKRTRVKK